MGQDAGLTPRECRPRAGAPPPSQRAPAWANGRWGVRLRGRPPRGPPRAARLNDLAPILQLGQATTASSTLRSRLSAHPTHPGPKGRAGSESARRGGWGRGTTGRPSSAQPRRGGRELRGFPCSPCADGVPQKASRRAGAQDTSTCVQPGSRRRGLAPVRRRPREVRAASGDHEAAREADGGRGNPRDRDRCRGSRTSTEHS